MLNKSIQHIDWEIECILNRAIRRQIKVDFSSETMQTKDSGRNLKITEGKKNCQPRIGYLVKIFFKDKIKIKTFPDEHKLRKLVTSRAEMYYQKNANGSYSGWSKNIAIEKQIYTKDEDCKNGNIMINIKNFSLCLYFFKNR